MSFHVAVNHTLSRVRVDDLQLHFLFVKSSFNITTIRELFDFKFVQLLLLANSQTTVFLQITYI